MYLPKSQRLKKFIHDGHAMPSRIKNDTVDRVLVHPEKSGGRSYTASFGRMVDNLADDLEGGVHAEHGSPMREGEAVPAGAAIQHYPVPFTVCTASP